MVIIGFAYANGKMVNIGYNPQTNSFGIQYYDGEVLSAGSKENTTIEADLNRDTNINTTADKKLVAGRINKISYSTGMQVNGYLVDLAESNPELASSLANKLDAKKKEYFIIKDDKLISVTKPVYDAISTEDNTGK